MSEVKVNNGNIEDALKRFKKKEKIRSSKKKKILKVLKVEVRRNSFHLFCLKEEKIC